VEGTRSQFTRSCNAARTQTSGPGLWVQMERHPDLLALIGRYGGYPRISAETWARWDAANTEYQFRLRDAQLTRGIVRSERPERGWLS
jgi:hypothetical protein